MEDIFSSVVIEPIDIIDVQQVEGQSYQQHCLAVYEKINLLKEARHDPSIAEKEALSTISTPEKVTNVLVPTGSPTSPTEVDVEQTSTVLVDELLLTVPHVEKGSMKVWTKYLSEHEHTVIKRIKEILSLQKRGDELTQVFESFSEKARNAEVPVKTRAKKQICEKFIWVSLAEHWLAAETAKMAEIAEDIEFSNAVSSDGLWLVPKTKEATGLIETLATKHVPAVKRLALDSRQVQQLVTVMFSSDPKSRANAKLDLSSKLTAESYAKMTRTTGETLETALAEAGLTGPEILATVFDRGHNDGKYMCLTCGTQILLSTTIYHTKCKTIRWLDQR